MLPLVAALGITVCHLRVLEGWTVALKVSTNILSPHSGQPLIGGQEVCIMKKVFGLVLVFALVLTVSASFAAESADVETAEMTVSKDVNPEWPAAKLAESKGISIEEAAEILEAAGVDPYYIPVSEAEAAGYREGDEERDLQFVKVWLRDGDGQRLVNVFQGHGKYRPGDRKYLFAGARRVWPVTDINGMSDGSSSIWSPMGSSAKRVVYGIVVSSQRTMQCKDNNGTSMKVWFNVLIDFRGRKTLDDNDTTTDGGGFLTYGKGGNLREGFDEAALNYIYMTPREWLQDEMEHGRDLQKEGYKRQGDPSYFAIYLAQPGEKVDADLICDRLLLEGKFRTLTRYLPEKPQFANGVPTLVRLDQSGKPLPERTNTGKKAAPKKAAKKGRK